MPASLIKVKVAPKGMGLNDFVAMQEGFFAAEGLDVEFDWKTFRGTQSSWKGMNISSGRRTAPYRRQTGRGPGRVLVGYDLQCQRRDGPRRHGRLRPFAVGDLRAAGVRKFVSRRT